MQEQEKNKVLGGFVWKFAERISSQGVSFILGIILARLLMPEEYGIVAMVQIFITIANVFVTSGFSTSLIQKKDADELDFSTILYCSMTMSVLMYSIIFIGAPFIADFYNTPQLTAVTRVYALILILYGYNSVQTAWVSRNMIFKKFFYATFSGTFLSGLLGVWMAYSGYGVWSIVAQGLANVFINMIVMRSIITWRPKLIFSWQRAKSLMAYGSKVLGADLIGTTFNELQQLLVGKMYTPADLALFNRGKQFPQIITSNIDSSIATVLFPAMSNHSDDPEAIKRLTRRSIQVSSFVMFFFMTLLAIVAEPLIRLLLTDKWCGCVSYLQMVCLSSMIGTVSTANLQAIKASGNSGIVLRLEIYKKPVYLFMIVCAAMHSVYAIALTFPIYAIYSAFVNMYPNRRILNYSMSEQMRDLLPAFVLALIMFIVCYPLTFQNWHPFLIMTCQGVISVVIYWTSAIIMRIEAYTFIQNLVLSKVRNRC